jgi:hypothetical protein
VVGGVSWLVFILESPVLTPLIFIALAIKITKSRVDVWLTIEPRTLPCGRQGGLQTT